MKIISLAFLLLLIACYSKRQAENGDLKTRKTSSAQERLNSSQSSASSILKDLD